MDLIYTLRPVNRTASTVTAQAGCTNGERTERQRLEDLQRCATSLNQWFQANKKGARDEGLAAEYGRQLLGVNKEINELKASLYQPSNNPRSVANHFVDVCREQLSPHEFKRLLSIAVGRSNEVVHE